MPASLAGRPHRLRRLAGHASATVCGLTDVGRVAQDRPDRRRSPVRRSGSGRHALLGERPADLDDRLAPLDVAVEDLPNDWRFELVDLVERVGVFGPLHIPVAVRRAREHRHRAGPGAVQLPPAAALRDLRSLVLGNHPLELTQQLVLRRARSLGLLGEHDLDPAARELLKQQHLVGVPARQPVRRMTQHDLEAPVECPVAELLERGSLHVRAREPVVIEHELVRDDQAALLGQLTQRGGLAGDRLLLALALRGHPRVDRRDPRLPVRPRDRAAHLRSLRCLSSRAARAPTPSTPAPASRRRGGRRRTQSQPAGPPPRCPAPAR